MAAKRAPAAFPPGVAAPAVRALASVGITTVAGCARLTEAELAALHGMGPKALGILKSALAAEGTGFASAAGSRGRSKGPRSRGRDQGDGDLDPVRDQGDRDQRDGDLDPGLGSEIRRGISIVKHGGTFTGTLFRYPGKGGWTFVPVPDHLTPPVTHDWGRTPVHAVVDGHAWDTSVWRDTKSDRTLLAVPKHVRGAKGDGDAVTVTIHFSL